MFVKSLESTRTNQSIVVSEPISSSRKELTEDYNQLDKLNKEQEGERQVQAAVGSSSGSEEEEEVDLKKRLKYHKRWNRRFKVLFWCFGYKRNKDSITDVAGLLAEFCVDLRVSSSELAAGIVLLSKYHEAQRQWMVKNHQFGVKHYLSSVPITEKTKFLDITTAEDSHLMNDLIYYMNYSLAIFGWPLQMTDNPFTMCCICPYLKLSPCSSSRRIKEQQPQQESVTVQSKTTDDDEISETKKKTKQQQQDNNYSNSAPQIRKHSLVGELDKVCDLPIILEDNFCGCNVASVERRLASHNYEIVYVSYKVDISVVPFMVACDHSKQSIVVALRGSMSLSDMITDMNGTIDRIPLDNCPDDWLCHRGITRAANYVKSTLLSEHILDAAFNCRLDLGSENYNLILCGHSLGAGVAAILGVLLRPNYPYLKAYLHSPPGGLLSLPLVEYTKEFATGVILGNDCVPRLGVAQIERLRYQTLLCLKSSQKSSGKILAKALCPSRCLGGGIEVDYEPNQSFNLLHGIDGRIFDYNGCKIPFQVQSQVLYVPGRLIHIVKNYSFKTKARHFFNKPIYQAIWNDNTMYDRVLIGQGMITDHLPNNLMYAMKMLFSKTLPTPKEKNKLETERATNIQTTTITTTTTTTNQQHTSLPDGNQDCKNEISNKVLAKKENDDEDDDEIFVDANNNSTDNNNNNNEQYDQKIIIDRSHDRNNNNNDNGNTDTPHLNTLNNDKIIGSSSIANKTEPDRCNSLTAISRSVEQQTQIISDKNLFDNNGNDETVLDKNH